MNPVRHIPMVPSPRKVPFIPRSSLQSIPAIRSLAWRRGAGDTSADPNATNSAYDPNVEAGTGTKSQVAPDGSSTGTTTTTLPAANTAVNSSTQVSVTPASGANLRDQPSLTGNILKGENARTILQVLGNQDGWLNVQDPQGTTGWIYSAYVADASSGQGTVDAPTVSATPLGATGIVGLLVAGGLVTGAYYLLVK